MRIQEWQRRVSVEEKKGRVSTGVFTFAMKISLQSDFTTDPPEVVGDTHPEIIKALGISKAQYYRGLKELKRHGFVVIKGYRITLELPHQSLLDSW